ncbi:hypothetical protein ES708_24512 [subsurface metagenome]
MKITKAIEILDFFLPSNFLKTKPDLKDATKLGREALKRCQELESPNNFSPMRPLPGEDPE